MKEIGLFYTKPFLIIGFINVLIYILFGTFFESYESIYNSFVNGTYTLPCITEWDTDVHFLVFSMYAKINSFFPGIQVYGIVLFSYNIIALTSLGLIIYRILYVNLNSKNLLLFTVLYCIVCIDNIINLSTVRIVFIGFASIIAYVESCRYEHKPISAICQFIFYIIILFLCLLRVEVIVLSSLFYVAILFIYNQFYKAAILPLLISSIMFITYNIIILNFSSEAKKVYYYKEIDFIFRDNYNLSKLSKDDSADVSVFYKNISNKDHFSMQFYNRIEKTEKQNGIENIFNGLNINAFINTFNKSKDEFRNSWIFIAYATVCCFFLFPNKPKYRYYWLLRSLLLLVLLPILPCFYIHIPARFLVPYYSVIGILNIFQYIRQRKQKSMVYYFHFIIITAIIISDLKYRENYLKISDNFNTFVTSINKIHTTDIEKNGLPVIVCSFDVNKNFSVNPLTGTSIQNTLIMNLYYYNSYDCYQTAWRNICNCNPLSVKEKLDYIVSNENNFIVSDATFKDLKNYVQYKYQLNLVQTNIRNFDRDLKTCNLKYSIMKNEKQQ
jgi:hypothetical protein